MNKTLSAFVATAMLAMTVLPGSSADPGGDDVQYTTDSCSLNVKQVVGIGIGDCGHASFDVRHWNEDPGNTGARQVTFWGQWVSGVFVTGFGMVACSDLNNDFICATGTDDFARAYSNDGVGTDGSTECNKDDKDCGDPTDAQLTLCVHADHDGRFDDLVVFIDDWADTGAGGNVGSGVSSGEYEIWLTYGPWVESCPPTER